MRRAAVLLLIAACGPTAAEQRRAAQASNASGKDRTLAAIVRARSLTPIERPGGTKVDGAALTAQVPRVRRGDGELLVAPATDGAPATTEILEPWCAPGGATSCGCRVEVDTRYYRDASGGVVVVRLVPDLRKRFVHADACPPTCDKLSPRRQTLRSLGSIDPARVDIVDVHYPYDLIIARCDRHAHAE